MTIEFKTQDPTYQGITVFPNETSMLNMSLFNDSLPADTPSQKIGLVQESAWGKRRFVITPTAIKIKPHNIILVGGGQKPPEITIPNEAFKDFGVEVYITDGLRHHKGKIYPK